MIVDPREGKTRGCFKKIEMCFSTFEKNGLAVLRLIGAAAAAADTLALCTSAQGSLMEAMQRGIPGHRKSPLTACLSPFRHLAPRRSNRKLAPLSLVSFLLIPTGENQKRENKP